jgi:hypothetical protein
MTPEYVEQRMAEMMQPINQQLFLCQSGEEELMLACAMLQRIKEIFDVHLGVDGRKLMFKDLYDQ